MKRVNGVIVPCITFFNERFEINNELNSLLIKHVLLNGADSLFLFGNTGEGIDFINKIDEKRKFVDVTLNYIDNRIPILLGAFGNHAEEVINQIELLGKQYNDLNFVITPPISRKLNEYNLESYFENILGSITLRNQIFLYNNPNRFAGNEIRPETM